jgi:8-oxo-dGTP pyrophosphatase MutT (NUDIX family)
MQDNTQPFTAHPVVFLLSTLYHSNASLGISKLLYVTIRMFRLRGTKRVGMDPSQFNELLQMLREKLVPETLADHLIDEEEGRHPEAIQAAVLLPLFERDGELFLLFIRRADTLRAHSGEIAFPGGRVEMGDHSLVATAVREAQEEIGLEPARVEIVGLLPPVFTVASNYVISPVVAFLPRGLGDLRLQASEVQELIIAPLSALTDPSIARHERWTRAGRTRTVYFYDYGQYCIWGATGRILKTFLERLKPEEVNAS